MKPVKDATLDELEETVPACVKAIKAYLAYQGDNPAFANKAKVSTGVITALGRLRSSETNRMQVELIAERITASAEEPKRLRVAK